MRDAEQWRPVLGWENWYSASDLGRIRSERTGKILAGGTRADGRHTVCLTDGIRPKTRLVYHLVLESFVGARPDGMEARHLNDKPSDDRLINLAWGTSSENKQDMIRNTGRNSCAYGHEYTDETTYWYGNTRQCRICRSTPSSTLCRIGDCEKPVLARELCSKHYHREHRHGDPHYLPPASRSPIQCTIEGCAKSVLARGMCAMHYSRMKRNGDPHRRSRKS